MIKNYFKIGFRNLIQNKLYAAVNIGGLAVGIGCFIIIMLFVHHELSYDKFYSHSGRIYRVYQKQTGNAFLGSEFFAITPTRLGSVLEEECPEVEIATTLRDQRALLSHDNNHYWQYGLAADDHFFKIFKPEFISGESQHVFGNARGIVLTASLAEKIFGDKDAIGNLITYQNDNTYTVTGVVNDPPTNSSFQYTYIVDIRSIDAYAKDLNRTTWRGNNAQTFLLLKPNATVATLEHNFAGIIKKYRDPEAYSHYPFQDQYFLERIEDLHLHAGINFDMGVKGNRQFIYLFSWVAVIVLVLACVNYMSLALARSVQRAREVGIRKVVGAQRSQIMAQFLGESVLIAFFAMALGLILAELILPIIGHWLERPISLNFTQNAWLLPALFALLVAVGLFSGSYPSFFLSSLRPVNVLKGKTRGTSALGFQRVLIIAQYTVSITLVIGSMVIHHQLQYMNEKELGYDRENIITIQLLDRSIMKHYNALAATWQRHPAIVATTSSNALPTNLSSNTIINDEDDSGAEDDLVIYECNVNDNFLGVFGISLAAGRTFSKDIKTDAEQAVLLNETAAKALGWSVQEAIGKQFIHNGPKTVVGVVKDFHMHSLHLSIQPLLMRFDPTWSNYIAVKIQPGKSAEVIGLLESTLTKYSPYPFDYQFLDDHFNKLYSTERKLGEMFGFFTIVSILIASLGLFGLAAFSATQRTKEIGIRKALGATASDIVTLLAKGFLHLIIIALLLSAPIGWYFMQAWLEDFAYRVDISLWTFVYAALLTLTIAGLTIAYQSFKASVTDAATTLRN